MWKNFPTFYPIIIEISQNKVQEFDLNTVLKIHIFIHYENAINMGNKFLWLIFFYFLLETNYKIF